MDIMTENNKPRMARVGTALMVENTHKTEVILMFIENCIFGIVFSKDIRLHGFGWDSNPQLVELLDFLKKDLMKKISTESLENC